MAVRKPNAADHSVGQSPRPLPPHRRDNRGNGGLHDLHETVSEAAAIIQRCYLRAQMNSEQSGINAHGSESSLGFGLHVLWIKTERPQEKDPASEVSADSIALFWHPNQ